MIVVSPGYSTSISGSIPGLGRSPGEGHGNPLQDSCLANPMDRGAWQASVHRVAKSQTQLSDSLTQTHTHTHTHTDYRRWYFKSELVELAFTFPQYFSQFRWQILKQLTFADGLLCATERVIGRKARGPQVEEISCKRQTFFFLFYTKLKRGFF